MKARLRVAAQFKVIAKPRLCVLAENAFVSQPGKPMLHFFSSLFKMDFMPHGSCYLWQTNILLLHTISDGLIAVSYFVIPVLLVIFVRKRKRLSFSVMFWMFAAFILLCGTTHVLNIVTIWDPVYRFEGLVKLVTGIASVLTAIGLLKLIPQMLTVPLPEEMAAVNKALAQQIAINRQSEDRLRQMNAELERRVAERTAALERSNQDLMQFAYIASHDLQEPLRMVSNYTELLQRRYATELNEDAQVFMKYAINGSRRMQELISDLLTYAQIERDAVPFREIQPSESVKRAIEVLRLAIEQHQARILVDKLPTVLGDEGQLAQVFQNLISNSLKYRSEAAPEIRIWAEQNETGDLWTFFVSDNGVGFDMQFKDRLFNMFQRLENRLPGTGIGLALCKKIVQYHGGQIDVKSEVGVGTTFFFTLPATKDIQNVI
jgi:signal transduction histidine kinase